MPALAEVRPTVIASVPLIMEKVYRGKVLPTFQMNSLMRTLYGWGWSRKLLHKVAGKQLKKLFGGRMRLFAIGGSKFDSRLSASCLRRASPMVSAMALPRPLPLSRVQ